MFFSTKEISSCCLYYSRAIMKWFHVSTVSFLIGHKIMFAILDDDLQKKWPACLLIGWITSLLTSPSCSVLIPSLIIFPDTLQDENEQLMASNLKRRGWFFLLPPQLPRSTWLFPQGCGKPPGRPNIPNSCSQIASCEIQSSQGKTKQETGNPPQSQFSEGQN